MTPAGPPPPTGPILLSHPASAGHRAPGHPERPERLVAIENAIAADPALAALRRVEPGAVDVDLLARVHEGAYVEAIERTGARCEASGEGGWLDADTWMGPGSLAAAQHAAGAAVEAARLVLAGEAPQAVSLCRPPGHHAETSKAMGFCLFNNIAVAAQAALETGLERVAVLDFDVHHGNGTQQIFYARADVLYLSCHQWPLYPGTGAANERGRGPGEGYTVNAPMPAGSREEDYLEVFDALFGPALADYRPELLLLSAGFDAHISDPLAGMRLRTESYGALAAVISGWAEDLCGGRAVWVLEGGYDLDGLAGSVATVLRELCGGVKTGA